MNAARALRFARRRAGLSQTELARRAGVPVGNVNRIERGQVVPRVDTLLRLLAAADATLTVEPRQGGTVDSELIRELLGVPERRRLATDQVEAIEELCRRRVRFVVIGDAAARLHGAPVQVSEVEVDLASDRINVQKFVGVLARGAAGLLAAAPTTDDDVWEDAEELPWIPAPKMRVMNRWLDAPSGFVASLDCLIQAADPARRETLCAVQEELDLSGPGLRIYRDPERRELRLPPSPRRYRYVAPQRPGPLSQIIRSDNS